MQSYGLMIAQFLERLIRYLSHLIGLQYVLDINKKRFVYTEIFNISLIIDNKSNSGLNKDDVCILPKVLFIDVW